MTTPYFRIAPTYTDPLLHEKTTNTSSSWYRWFQNTEEGVPPQSEIVATVSASPFTYTAPRGGFVIVSGGTVSAIAISRTTVFYATGLTSGTFTLSKNDKIKVTYSGLPSIIFFAQ
jgi:hypothetical protein